jgi:Superinfection immunity protein/zinc-ribbon domain
VAWNKPDFGSVLAINFFLGWTLVGWVVALAWALKSEAKPTQVVVQQSPAAPGLAVFCSACGKYSQHGSKFCSHCGHSLVSAIRA